MYLYIKKIIVFYFFKILILDDIGEHDQLRKIKFYSRKDYDILSPYEAIKYDKRPFFILLHDKLIDDHPIYNLFFYQSVMEPLWFRMLCFFTDININFLMSALFFSDDYIDARAELPKELRVILYLKK